MADLAAQAEKDRERLKKRSRDAFAAAAELGELPKVKDPARRERCRNSLKAFLAEYFPRSTGLKPWGQCQIDAIDRIEVALRFDSWIANILPRGFTKSTISENSILWALLYGYRRYCLFFAGDATLATTSITSIQRELVRNPLLRDDFPEACIPFRALEGKNRRCDSQTYRGELTGIICNRDMLRLANIPGFAGAGGIIEAYGLLAPPRGARDKSDEGENLRPDCAVLDDPQTDVSAKSSVQTASRLEHIHNSIAMMGGHGAPLSMIVNATVIKDGDLADRISQHDAWQSVRVSMMPSLPTNLERLWLGQYAKIRKTYDRNDPMGKVKAKLASTEFYKQHRDEMDTGASCSWYDIPLPADEVSAIQHGMNIWIDKGESVFWSECQNKPLRATSVSSLEITEEVQYSFSGYAQNVVPVGASHVVFGCDVHDNLIYWTVSACDSQFTGSVLSYGTWPQQNVGWFSKNSAKITLQSLYGNEDQERLIEIGLEDIIGQLLRADWRNAHGDVLRVSCGLVDCGYKPQAVSNAIRRLLPASNIVLCSHGIGIGPTKKPFAEYDLSPKRVIRCGPDTQYPRWIIPTEHRDGDIYRVNFDTNFWKDTTAARLMQGASVGRWTLFSEADHGHFVSHLMSESPNAISANGRTVNVWENKRGDNHWWDTLVLCVLAASLSGAVLPTGVQIAQVPTQPIYHEPEQAIAASENSWHLDDGRNYFAFNR